MAGAVDPSKSYVLYKVTCDDLKDELSIIEDDLVKTPPVSLRSLQFSESELTKTYQTLDVYWTNSHDAIESDEFDVAYRNHRALKRNAWKVLSDVKSAIDVRLAQQSGGQTQFSSPNPSQVVVPVKHLPHPKMPEIKIPEFDGQLNHWSSFWDSFSSLIDSRPDIDPVLKFNMLKSYLRDKAFKTIEGLPVTNDNYHVAIKLLKSRFADDKRLLQKLHLDLMNMKTPRHNLSELTEFFLTFQRLLMEIEGVTKVPSDDYLIKDIIAKKLSPETLEFLFNKYHNYDLTITQLTDGIEGIIKGMERSQELSDQSVKFKKDVPNQDSSNKPKVPHSSSFNSKRFSTISKQVAVSSQSKNSNRKIGNSSSTQNGWNKPCLFCSEIHNTKYCTNYSTHESRRNRVRDLELCFICMKKGHKAADCRIKPECRQCSGKHHTFLCMKLTNHSNAVNQVTTGSNSQNRTPNSGLNSQTTSTNGVSNSNNPDNVASNNQVSLVQTVQLDMKTTEISLAPTALPTAIVNISGGGIREVVRIFLDTGAQRTFIHSDLARRLNLKSEFRVSLRLTAFGNKTEHTSCDVVKVTIRIGSQRIVISAVVHDEVNTIIHVPGITKVVETLKGKGIKLADPNINSDTVDNIGLVIGADYYSKFVSNSSFYSGVTLLSSPAGSIIFGPMPKWAFNSQSVNAINVQNVFCARVGVQSFESELEQVNNLWNLDVVGIKNETLTPEESQSLLHFEKTCQKLGNQYFVELPFKSDERPATNYRKSYGQLISLSKSFKSRPDLYEQYCKIFDDYVELGFIEKVNNPSVVDGLTHYLPHHPVYKNSPTTPIRVVFNASSKSDVNSKSLNDCLLTGPTLTSKLLNSLLEFRTNPIAVIADISKAFLRIGILPHCRDFCRFLWFEDETLEKVITYRFRVVIFGATSSPFLLQKTLIHHLETHSNPLSKSLISKFYVDNFCSTYSDLVQLNHDFPVINTILSDASLPLQGWVSNDAIFNENIGVDHETINIYDVNVLGLSWNTVNDEISLYPSKKVGKDECKHHHHQITKRLTVSVISSVYDPLGLMSPVLIKGKLFIQKLWQTNYSWDEIISESLAEEFKIICKELNQVSNIKYPRFVINPGMSELHIFCDSSQVAYGLAVYAVNSGDKSSNLIMSKARVAPTPALTIPKLELLSLTFASRLAQTLLTNEKLSFRNCILWCDSEVAINWVYHDKSTEVFVRNRVSEIRTLRSKYNFSILHVPSTENPADLLTRGVSVLNLSNSLKWKHGPSFLLDPSEYPPQKEFIFNSIVVSEILSEPTVLDPILSHFDMSKFSSLTKLKRIVSYILRFCNSYFPDKFKLNDLHACIRIAQLQSFPTLFAFLKNPEQSPKPTVEVMNLAKQLDLYLNDDQLICSSSRLQNSDLSSETQFPIYLPAKHPLTKLIITHYHNLHHHCGLGQMLTGLRKQFWISKSRAVIKGILHKCILCRKVIGKTLSQPNPPPLPELRVKHIRPFHAIGVDFTGSISIFDPTTTSNFSEKVYVCLFTCTTSRAVHLELCRSLTTSDFLLAFRRFASRFGIPSVVISDNGTNFRGAERFLNDIKDEPEVMSYMQDNNILWKFNTPRSPWSGGFFERLIGCVKSSLHKALYKKRVSFVELHTLLCEIECVVNSRPLTYMSDDIKEEYLTPSHLIYGRTITLFPPLNSFGADVPFGESLDLRVQYSRLSNILKKYKEVWMDSYLTSLRERHLTCAKDKPCQVQVGDLVLIVIENKQRSDYPLGLVTQLIPGNDNIVRSVVLRTANTVYVRPISKLIPLEIHQEPVPEIEPVVEPNPIAIPIVPHRPKRQATARAEQTRRDLIANNLL